jgi:hypothetical protein
MTKSFNSVYVDGERLDGYQIIDTDWDKEGICKRCGKPFTKKYREQIFCSRLCVSRYRTRINEMVEKYGDEFERWLDNEMDCSYSPEKF